MSACQVDGCQRRIKARGYCQRHYDLLRRHGNPTAGKNTRRGPSCSVDGCDRPVSARQLCNTHYSRWWKHGDATIVIERACLPLADRFWALVDRRGADECWLWTGGLNQNGYGSFNISEGDSRTTARAHRVAYELLVGPIPEGLEIDHVKTRGCTSRACVNPAHLEPVTHTENLRRAEQVHGVATPNGRKTCCKNGHAFTPENTYRWRGTGSRQCKTCRNDRIRAFRARNKRVAA